MCLEYYEYRLIFRHIDWKDELARAVLASKIITWQGKARISAKPK